MTPDLTLRHALDTAARAAITVAWHIHAGNMTHAAVTLCVSSRQLRREVERLGMWPALDGLGYTRQNGPARGGAVAVSAGGADS